MDADGTLANYGTQEQASIRREAGRLHKYFDGIRVMDRIPAALFVVDIRREHNAVAEARKLKVPVVAFVDTNCDPDLVTFPIAANDDAIRSIRMILTTVGQTVTLAQAEFESRRPRHAAEETVPAETQPVETAPAETVPVVAGAVPQATA